MKKEMIKKKTIYVNDRKKIQLVLAAPKEKLSSGAKLVFLNLLSRLFGKATCWPSQQRIGADLALSARQVRKHLDKLVEFGAVIIIDKTNLDISTDGHHFRSNQYDMSNVLRLKEVNVIDKSEVATQNEEEINVKE
ncbi:MAG: helix-turn-helix domain-containing protein [Patescibacteria group bacterium]